MLNSLENIFLHSYFIIKKDHQKLFYMYMNFDSLPQNSQKIILQFKEIGKKFFEESKHLYEIQELPFSDDFIEECFFQLGLSFFRIETIKKLLTPNSEFKYLRNQYIYLENEQINILFNKIKEHFILLNS